MPHLSTAWGDWPAFTASALVLITLVGLGEGLRIKGHVAPEVTRRVVHLGVGLFVVVTPWVFARPDLIYVLAVVFVVLNGVALRRGWFGGMHGTDRRSFGTVTFPLVLIPALWLGWTLDPGRVWAMQLAFLILAVADPLASTVGTVLDDPKPFRVGGHTKSVAGSLAFFGTTLLLSLGALGWLWRQGTIDWAGREVLMAALIVTCVATAVEILGGEGWDNFFIVIAVLISLVYFDEHPAARLTFFTATGIGLVFGAATYGLKLLALSGAVAGGLLAVSQVGMIGWAWVMPGFTFFLLSSALSKIGNRHKAEAEELAEKGSVRDAGQVFANGGVAWVMLILYVFFPGDVLYLGFVGAFAAATADTWGTEVGTLFRGMPRLITTGRPVPRGTSGAISLPGTLAAGLGALVIGLCTWPFASNYLADIGLAQTLAVVTVSGLAASLIDSLVGATLQAHYRDPLTWEASERPVSEHGAHLLVGGRRWLRNDQVNWLCTLVGALLAMACFLLL